MPSIHSRTIARALVALANKLATPEDTELDEIGRKLIKRLLSKGVSWEQLSKQLENTVTALEDKDKDHTWAKKRGQWYVVSNKPSAAPAASTTKEGGYIIVVAEVVRGRSKGPKGFKRFKPFKYSDGGNSHPIVYADWLPDSTEDQAIQQANKAYIEMNNLARRQDTSTGNYVKSFSIVLHDVANDKAVPYRADAGAGNKGYLYDSSSSSNELLKKWKIL